TMDELIDNLKMVYPDGNDKDIDLLNRTFGSIRFVYLKRGDFAAQAVSRLKAEQTDLWHVTDREENVTPEQIYQYDFKKIQEFAKEATEHNSAWIKWFKDNCVEPYEVLYENLSQDPMGEASKVLDFLALALPPNTELSAKNKKMADGLSASWIERYKSEVSNL